MNCRSGAVQLYVTGRAACARPLPASTDIPKTSADVASVAAVRRLTLTAWIIGGRRKLLPSLVRGFTDAVHFAIRATVSRVRVVYSLGRGRPLRGCRPARTKPLLRAASAP